VGSGSPRGSPSPHLRGILLCCHPGNAAQLQRTGARQSVSWHAHISFCALVLLLLLALAWAGISK
jgi:hypothetical protein